MDDVCECDECENTVDKLYRCPICGKPDLCRECVGQHAGSDYGHDCLTWEDE